MVEKIYPEEDSSGQTAADFVYNTIVHQPASRVYKKNEFKGRIIFSNKDEFGAIDTGGTTVDMMKSVRAQGIWDKLNANPKLISQEAADEVNSNLMGSWSLPGRKECQFPNFGKYHLLFGSAKEIPV